MQCSMAWALHRTEKEKPAAGKTDYWRDFWRSGWDSNPRNLAVQLISSQSRYDHFDTAPYLSQHQHLGKRGELMGRTSKNIKLRIPEKPRKIKGFRSGSYRVATTISSQSRYGRFDTPAYIFWHRLAQRLEKCEISMQDNDEKLGTRHPIKPAVMGFPADKVTCRMQTFESISLRPLRYVCLFSFYRIAPHSAWKNARFRCKITMKSWVRDTR